MLRRCGAADGAASGDVRRAAGRVLAFATAGGAARWCELDVMCGGLVAPPAPGRLPWFGRTVS